MVHGAALEKRSPFVTERGFESHPLRCFNIINEFSPQYYGEVLEWPNRRAWRARVAFGYRGFESHPLRHPIPGNSTSLSPSVDWTQLFTDRDNG